MAALAILPLTIAGGEAALALAAWRGGLLDVVAADLMPLPEDTRVAGNMVVTGHGPLQFNLVIDEGVYLAGLLRGAGLVGAVPISLTRPDGERRLRHRLRRAALERGLPGDPLRRRPGGPDGPALRPQRPGPAPPSDRPDGPAPRDARPRTRDRARRVGPASGPRLIPARSHPDSGGIHSDGGWRMADGGWRMADGDRISLALIRPPPSVIAFRRNRLSDVGQPPSAVPSRRQPRAAVPHPQSNKLFRRGSIRHPEPLPGRLRRSPGRPPRSSSRPGGPWPWPTRGGSACPRRGRRCG